MNRVVFAAALLASVGVANVAQAETFNGGYAGAVVGYDKLSLKVTTGGSSATLSGDSVTGGLMVGYNAKVSDSFVLGGEIEGVIGGGKLTDGFDTVKTDYSLNAGVRAGFLATQKLMVYGKVAYARTQLSDGTENDSGDGVAFGGGVELAFSGKMSGRVAYTRTSYSVSNDLKAAFGADINLHRDQVTAGVSFHF